LSSKGNEWDTLLGARPSKGQRITVKIQLSDCDWTFLKTLLFISSDLGQDRKNWINKWSWPLALASRALFFTLQR